MGPSLESNGMADARGHGERADWASMGPSLESNGMYTAQGKTTRSKRSFNGAVARKQRNGRLCLDLVADDRWRFNGAVARKQRNVPGIPPQAPPETRFNGAVARKQRNVGIGEVFGASEIAASMGPSLESNGMPEPRTRDCGESGSLQWGRRSKATECCDLPQPHPASRTASMGPSLESNGMRSRSIQAHASRTASMGPSLESNGMSLDLFPCRRTALASMGPSLESNGMLKRFQCAERWPLWLQWGRRSKATECSRSVAIASSRAPASMGPSLESNGM